VHLARGTGPYMYSLFSKCPYRVVVVRSWDRWLVGEAVDPTGKIHWARTRPSAKSLPADSEGNAGKRQWDWPWSQDATIPGCPCGVINAQTLKTN